MGLSFCPALCSQSYDSGTGNACRGGGNSRWWNRVHQAPYPSQNQAAIVGLGPYLARRPLSYDCVCTSSSVVILGIEVPVTIEKPIQGQGDVFPLCRGQINLNAEILRGECIIIPPLQESLYCRCDIHVAYFTQVRTFVKNKSTKNLGAGPKPHPQGEHARIALIARYTFRARRYRRPYTQRTYRGRSRGQS